MDGVRDWAGNLASPCNTIRCISVLNCYLIIYNNSVLRRNWLQQLEEDTGLSVGAAWIAGQDRSMWRTLRPSAGQAQQ